MKLRKLVQRAAAAAVVSAMALSISMPALAQTWDLSNGRIAIKNSAGDTYVQQVDASGSLVAYVKDNDITITGKYSGYDNGIYINASSGVPDKVTLRDVEIDASSADAIQIDHGDAYKNVNLVLEGSNKLSSDGSAISNDGSTLTIGGSGRLEAAGLYGSVIDTDNLTIRTPHP